MRCHLPGASVSLFQVTTLTVTAQHIVGLAHFLTTELSYIPRSLQSCNSMPVATPLPQQTLCEGVLNGTIPSAVSNTGATSHALLLSALSIPTGIPSKEVFHLPNRTTAAASTVNKLLHNIREPAQSANIVTTLTKSSLNSTSKFVDARYTNVYNDKEVNY